MDIGSGAAPNIKSLSRVHPQLWDFKPAEEAVTISRWQPAGIPKDKTWEWIIRYCNGITEITVFVHVVTDQEQEIVMCGGDLFDSSMFT
ncbi:MAG: hypothetical protein HFH68_00590 [Lachnospiraceae bacterium]|nr:hypothetical protein [Lachnospiraceae bacterium]